MCPLAALAKLLSLQPKDALLVTLDNAGNVAAEERIGVDLVQRGDIIQVGPGEKVPADGTIIWGASYVDESMVTGEPVAVPKLVNRCAPLAKLRPTITPTNTDVVRGLGWVEQHGDRRDDQPNRRLPHARRPRRRRDRAGPDLSDGRRRAAVQRCAPRQLKC